MTVIAPAQGAAVLATLHAEAFETPWTAAAIDNLLAQSGVFALAHADGFILCRAVADEAEILTLAVRPTARRGGVGRALVIGAADFAAGLGAGRLFLEVAEDNVAARALYAAVGFREEGRRRAYYARAGGPAADALILVLNLSDRLPTD